MSGKQLNSQLVTKILFPYMTDTALVFTLGKNVEVATLSVKEGSPRSEMCVTVCYCDLCNSSAGSRTDL